MKAIVLTCDKYIAFAYHTILTYEKRWPNNSFTYRIPYNSTLPEFIQARYGNKVEFVQTPSPIRDTALKLFEDLPDDEWIYWCMDDRYIVRADYKELQKIHDCVVSIDDPTICSVLAIAARPLFHREQNHKFLDLNSYITTASGLKLYETIFTESEVFKETWRPQFIRVKWLRNLFQSFPDYKFSAKEMDSFEKKKPKGEKFFVPEKNLMVVGESTHRGELTENCASSFKKLGLKIPGDFLLTKKYMLQGKMPYSLFGIEYSLHPNLQWWITSLERWYWRQR
jgi:hypothetical protein